MANPRPFQILDKEASRYLRRLIEFIGPDVIEKALKRYHGALSSSNPIFADYHIRSRHPWWAPLSKYFELESAGKSVWKHLKSPAEKLMIGDAYKIQRLHPDMPDSVRDKFKRDLVDNNNAWNYLFEIQMAAHFYQRGHKIEWYEDNGDPRPEFRVIADGVDFDVECKRISVDTSRKVRRSDFYRFADKIIPAIKALELSGSIDIVLDDRLHSSDRHLGELCRQVNGLLKSEGVFGEFDLPFGTITLDLNPRTGERYVWSTRYKQLSDRRGESGHAIIVSGGSQFVAVDPIEMTLVSVKADKVLRGIRNVVKTAANRQFDKTRPGLIICHLEGIDDLAPLSSDSGLQVMSSLLLGREDFSHIAGISYCSDTRSERFHSGDRFSNQGLIFRNPNCIFDDVAEYKFMSEDLDGG